MSEVDNAKQEQPDSLGEGQRPGLFRIRFREEGQLFVASSVLADLPADGVVMVKTDHGLEPALLAGVAPIAGCCDGKNRSSFEIARVASDDEGERFRGLTPLEDRGFTICQELIAKHRLEMRLVRVERFFNGSKMIFYFTADNRVDFRGLVKDLVQEFRTRVEMRQVGVRHETKMLGGIGTCGRELCCASFIKKFDSVSIKMAKEQDLPLNPTKISGLCNRLLCCLTYEYDSYRRQRKGMPKPGRRIRVGEEVYKVKRQNPLQQTLVVVAANGEEKVLQPVEWQEGELIRVDKAVKKEKKAKE